MNLASNAIKFTPEGGSIVVRWKIEPRDSTQTLVKVSVADTGVGIPPHSEPAFSFRITFRDATTTMTLTLFSSRLASEMDRLFKSFSQIDSSITRSYGGSGEFISDNLNPSFEEKLTGRHREGGEAEGSSSKSP